MKTFKFRASILAYRTPSMKSRESRVLDMISTYLSGGQSSILYKKLVDKKKDGSSSACC